MQEKLSEHYKVQLITSENWDSERFLNPRVYLSASPFRHEATYNIKTSLRHRVLVSTMKVWGI